MSYKKLLVHRCDVYHLSGNEETAGSFGISADKFQQETTYSTTPDMTDTPCYFVEKSQSITQNAPNNTLVQSYLVHFWKDADIRLHDKVVWGGEEYILQQPRLVQNHHWEVIAIREDNL